jgi:hypothetical protein
VRILVLQYCAESFPVVEGEVVSGDVVTTHGSKGSDRYHPSFSYKYQVAGHTYTGRRYRYDGLPLFSVWTAAQQIVQEHQAGSKIEVHYNPANPRDVVLSTPVKAYDIAFLVVGFAACLIPLWCLVGFSRGITLPGRAKPIAGGVKIISDGNTTRVRVPRRDPMSMSLWTLFVFSSILGTVMYVDATMALGVAEILVVFIVFAGVAVYFWLQKRISSGSQDLVIDEAARTVELPLTYKRRERMRFAFSEITGVRLEEVMLRRQNTKSYTWSIFLLIVDKSSERLTILGREEAEAFAAWLREKIGLQKDAGAIDGLARDGARN